MLITGITVVVLYIAAVIYIVHEVRHAPYWDEKKQKFVDKAEYEEKNHE